ncbi:hypothetical protein GQR58_026055 [Nymphon striatum]|nr:hypothetical protein GQR58_026055 [Nymphon striatum]
MRKKSSAGRISFNFIKIIDYITSYYSHSQSKAVLYKVLTGGDWIFLYFGKKNLMRFHDLMEFFISVFCKVTPNVLGIYTRNIKNLMILTLQRKLCPVSDLRSFRNLEELDEEEKNWKTYFNLLVRYLMWLSHSAGLLGSTSSLSSSACTGPLLSKGLPSRSPVLSISSSIHPIPVKLSYIIYPPSLRFPPFSSSPICYPNCGFSGPSIVCSTGQVSGQCQDQQLHQYCLTSSTMSNQRHIIPEIVNFMKSHIITPTRDFVVFIITERKILGVSWRDRKTNSWSKKMSAVSGQRLAYLTQDPHRRVGQMGPGPAPHSRTFRRRMRVPIFSGKVGISKAKLK